MFKKIITLLTVTVLFLFTFFNLILDAPRIFERCLCCLYPVSGRSGWGSYSRHYPPFNNAYMSFACAAYQCLGGVAGAAILISILPVTMRGAPGLGQTTINPDISQGTNIRRVIDS
jgi:hypothetical protein